MFAPLHFLTGTSLGAWIWRKLWVLGVRRPSPSFQKTNSWIVDASSVVTAALSVIRVSAELCSRLLSPFLLLYIETPPGDDVDNCLVQPLTRRRPERKGNLCVWAVLGLSPSINVLIVSFSCEAGSGYFGEDVGYFITGAVGTSGVIQ